MMKLFYKKLLTTFVYFQPIYIFWVCFTDNFVPTVLPPSPSMKPTLVKECGFKCGWCEFNPDSPHWNHIDKVGNVACIWFMWIYSFLILWLECGLCGFLNFNNILCGLFVAFVDLHKSLLLKSTCDMVLMHLHVDSVSIYTLKSQSRRTPYRLYSTVMHLQ